MQAPTLQFYGPRLLRDAKGRQNSPTLPYNLMGMGKHVTYRIPQNRFSTCHWAPCSLPEGCPALFYGPYYYCLPIIIRSAPQRTVHGDARFFH